MDRDDVFIGLFGLATALCAGEMIYRLRDRNVSRARFLRERWTLEKSWERFDALSGWELIPGFVSDDLRINRHGFRGPELVGERTFRVMCLGDSVTFGPMGEKNPYPHVAREELLNMKTARPVEVINAGVGGHSSGNMRFRVKRLMRFRPDAVVIFAGWNDMYSDDITAYADKRASFSSYWHIAPHRNVRSHLLAAIGESAYPERRHPEPIAYKPSQFVPFNFEYNLREIIAAVRLRHARAALMTLPKLIPDDIASLTPQMKKKTMLPSYLDAGRYKDFITVYRAYDAVIRRVAEDTDSPVIDTEALFEGQKRPRNTFFEDTCHLTVQGQKLAGKFLAGELVRLGLVP